MSKWGPMDNKDEDQKEYAVFTVISQFRIRYVVPMEEGDTVKDLADLIICQEVEEFSQEHLGEVIVDSTCLPEDSMLELFNKDNSYLSGWTKAKKLEWIANNASKG